MKTYKKYKVNLSKNSGWNTDFLKDCKKCNNVFDVERVKDGLVYLYKPGRHTASWNHNIKYGEFIEEISIHIEKDLFKI